MGSKSGACVFVVTDGEYVCGRPFGRNIGTENTSSDNGYFKLLIAGARKIVFAVAYEKSCEVGADFKLNGAVERTFDVVVVADKSVLISVRVAGNAHGVASAVYERPVGTGSSGRICLIEGQVFAGGVGDLSAEICVGNESDVIECRIGVDGHVFGINNVIVRNGDLAISACNGKAVVCLGHIERLFSCSGEVEYGDLNLAVIDGHIVQSVVFISCFTFYGLNGEVKRGFACVGKLCGCDVFAAGCGSEHERGSGNAQIYPSFRHG